MIKHWRARVMVDPRGKIKTGVKARTSEGKEYPKSLDHFNISAFPELVQAYGEKPTAFVVMFPSDEPLDFFDCWFEHWGGRKQADESGTLIRRCDGEVCLHRINETVGAKTYAAGEESACVCEQLDEKDKQRCRYVARLKAWIVIPQTGKVDNPLCYRFETGSRNSGDGILSALNDVRVLTAGVLRGIPFSLSVKMIPGKDDAKIKFPIWTLIPLGTVTQMRERSRTLLSGDVAVSSAVPLLAQAPGAVEDPVVKDSRLRKEAYRVQIKACLNPAALTKIKNAVNEDVRKGLLTQNDYDALLDAMKARYEEVKPK